MRHASLDWALADGADAGRSAQLRLRAAQLLEPRTRCRLADRFELVLDDCAAQSRPRVSAAAPLQRESIAAAHGEMLRLVAALRTAQAPCPRGVAMAMRLLTDDAGPLYAPYPGAALRYTAGQIITELEADEVRVAPARAAACELATGQDRRRASKRP
jgi:hypothetical protein